MTSLTMIVDSSAIKAASDDVINTCNSDSDGIGKSGDCSGVVSATAIDSRIATSDLIETTSTVKNNDISVSDEEFVLRNLFGKCLKDHKNKCRTPVKLQK